MAERDHDLAITPEPAFHARLREELLARLAASPTQAAERGPDQEVVVVDIEGASAKRRGRGPAIVAIAAAAVIAVVAGVIAVSRSGDPDLLGPNRPATGAPVTVGFLTEDADGPDARAARAAARYVNEHLGGIRGRPLELDVCSSGALVTASQPEAAACADRFAAAKLPAVLHGYSTVLATPEGILTNLGVPLVTDVGGGIDGGGSGRGTYRVGSLDAGGAGPAAVAAAEGARRVAILVSVQGAQPEDELMFGLANAIRPYYERAGVEFTLVADPLGAPDRLRAALADADQVQIISEDPTCAATLRAVRDTGFAGPVSFGFNCATPAVAREAAGLMAGTRLLDARAPSGTDGAAVRYRAVLAEYDPDLDTSVLLAASGYRVVLAFAEVLGAAPGEVTVAAVRSAFETMPPLPLPLSLGQTFRCDGKQVRDKPRDCFRGAVVSALDADGRVTSSKVVDLTKILGP